MAGKAKGKTSRAIVWVILILLVVGLAGFGATSFNSQLTAVGKVGDTEISINRYSRELQQELQAISAQTGQNMTLSQVQPFGLDQAVLQRLIDAAAIEDETRRIGLSVGDEEVQRQVLSNAAFNSMDGKFDRDAYQFALDRAGLDAAGYEDSVRAGTSSNLLEAAISTGLTAPATYSDVILGYVGERRNFSWIELDLKSLSQDIPAPTQPELQAYYDDNTQDFMLPEIRKLTFAWLSPDAIVANIEVDDAALREIYQERISEYNRPERRLVERLVFGTKDEAAGVLTGIADGSSTFEDAVANRGLALQDVDLGDVTRDALGDAGDAVFSLTEPGIAGPIETDLGPAIFRINAILAASETKFEEVREILQEEYAADAARRRISDQIADLDDLLAGGATLEQLADETNMTLGQMDWFSGQADGIAAYEDFAAAAAEIAEGDFPEIIELDDGGIFALRLNEIVATHPEPFEDAKIKVEDAWKLSKIKEQLVSDSEGLKSQIDGGATISSLGYPVTVETNRTRNTFVEGAPADFLVDVFEMDASETAIIEADESVLVVYMSDILPPDEADPEAIALREAISAETAQSIGQDALSAFTRAVEASAGISLDQSALNAVHAQFP